MTFNIPLPDPTLLPRIQQKIDNLNKPKGSLGLLEELAKQICLVQQTLNPELRHPCHLLLGGDHGIEREGVSVSPRCVTWQQMENFTRGGGGVNMFCRQHGFKLRIVDVGVDHDLSHNPNILQRKIAPGTRNFLHEPAMTPQQMEQAMAIGAQLATDCATDDHCNILAIGEMGIANTSPSSLWLSLLAGVPLDECIGAGAGLDAQGMAHKRQVLAQALQRFRSYGDERPEFMVQYFGGFEMVAAIGAMLRAAEQRMLVLVDGFIMTACAMAATAINSNLRPYLIFAHQGDEHAHAAMLRHLKAKPLLSLGLRLGEGTGALCAYPIVDSAVRMVNEMNTFQKANITKYF